MDFTRAACLGLNNIFQRAAAPGELLEKTLLHWEAGFAVNPVRASSGCGLRKQPPLKVYGTSLQQEAEIGSVRARIFPGKQKIS